jgi:hypothetical protein
MGQAAAGFVRGGRIDSGVAYLDEGNFAIRVHDISHAIRHAVRAQNTIRLRGGAIPKIAEQRECQFELFSEDFLGGRVVAADAKNLGVLTFKFCDTSLVRGEFLRSATGEGGRKERQDDWILAFVIGQRDFTAHGRAERKVGRGVPHLQRSGIAGLLGEHRRA